MIILAAIEDEEQSARHVVAAEADGAPGAIGRDAQAEVDVCVAVVRNGEGEGEGAIGRNKGRLAGGVVGIISEGRRCEGCCATRDEEPLAT